MMMKNDSIHVTIQLSERNNYIEITDRLFGAGSSSFSLAA
jgi:hypothetical protein